MRNLRGYLALLGPSCPPPEMERVSTLTCLIGFIYSLQCFVDVCFKHIIGCCHFKTKTCMYFIFFLCWFHSQRSNTTHDPKTSLDLQETADLALCLHPPKLKLMLVYLFEERIVGLYISAFNSISFNSPSSGYRDYWTPDLWNLKLRRASQPI